MRYISEKKRIYIAQRANFRCEYCLIPDMFLATIFHIEHIRSIKHGGKNDLENLAYACPHCNQNKGSDIATFLSDESNEIIRLFNPRTDIWANHFENNIGQIIGLSNIGIATSKLLDFNQIERLILRKELFSIGLYP
jgi:hypothetical protein